MSGVKRISVFIIFFAVLTIFTGAVTAADWNVSAGDSIQTVINSASANDTITVNDNNGTAYTYTENVVINKKINLQAASNLVTVQALNSSNPIFTINSGGSGSTIQGFLLSNATNSSAIYLNSANNCNITGNTISNNSNGIYAKGNNVIISGNTVTGNSGDGIILYGNNEQILQNYAVNNNGTGIRINDNGNYAKTFNNVTITNNNVSGNNNGILIYRTNYVTLSGNDATEETSTGIYVGGNNVNITSDNLIHDNGGDGLVVYGSNVLINGLHIYNVVNGIRINDNGNYAKTFNNVTITNNNVSGNTNGILAYRTNIATVSGNIATGNTDKGIDLNGDTLNVTSNMVTSNKYGIYISSSSANINFNRIAGNSIYGLYISSNGIINATNNWWGSNNGPLVSSTSPSDICIASGTVSYNPWLVFNITTNPVATNNNSTITVDLTHNNAGDDTSSQGNIPDNIPITFITNLGNITNPVYTRNGKTNTTFARGTYISGIANITATLDNQTLETNVFFDETPLAIFINQVGGLYNTSQNVTLITIDPDCNAITYYTTDGSDPKINGIVYSNPITINTTTTLRYIAFGPTINWGPEYTQNYIIDTTLPTATANIIGGVYNTTQTVNLTATDNVDPNPVIYYTLDGSDPTTSSVIYTSPIILQINLPARTIIDLKFMAVDMAGNHGQIQTETYILTLPVVNINNNNTYSTIQDAINDNSTLSGDVIQIYSGTYLETVIVNKTLTIMPVKGNNVTIQAADSNHNVFTITNSGNGSIIQELTLNGNINLQANDCTISMNTIIGNGTSGIITSNSLNNNIVNNEITCNGFNGIQTNSSLNTIYGNNIHGCESGIYSENSNNKISSNDLTNNLYGIWTNNSTDTIQFNRIAQNIYGLRNDIGTLNATNNWWGTNNPSNPNDIWIVSGNVNYTSWLVLSLNASSTNSGGNSSVTADLTHNNQGEDTTPQGHVPNDIPVNFTTNYGTIITTSYTVKGRATTILNLGSTQNATVTTTASLDNQNISTTGFISTGTAILTINSTAIDNSTGQPLNTTYTIPLNNSVTWLSVVWINTGMFTDELQIIVNGVVVQNKYFNNIAYITWQNSYSTSVFNAIKYVNHHLPFISSTELTTFWNNLTTTYNLTSTELEFIQNHTQDFKDNLTVNIVYPGVTGLNLTVTDPHSNVINLNFPGNVIQRTSQVIYIGSPGEGVKSFAIATTDVTNDVFQYWQDQYSSYQTGDAMNVAYNTFLTALMVEYLHDRIANNITTSLNVTWSRTNPVIVSVGEDPYQIYETLESDHSMGMTVIGTIENTKVFNFVTSNSLSYIEYEVISSAYNSTFSSVTMLLLYEYFNDNTYVDTFEENGFIIIKSIFNDNFVVIDLETGIVRDIDTVNNCYGGIYEFGGRTTDFGKIYFFKQPVKMLYWITAIGFKAFVWQVPNPWDLGTAPFIWDGKGRVYISRSSLFLVNITADNILTITGPNGQKIVEGTQEALDITDILNEDLGLQILYIELKDTDGGWIQTSPLYIVQKTLDRQDLELPRLFPCPAPFWPPTSEDENPPYGPTIKYKDIYDFFKKHMPTPEETNARLKQESEVYYAIGAGIVIAAFIFGGAITGAFS